MKAIVFRAYGSPDVLRCEEIEKPTAKNDEVLIRVRAAAANPLDWHVMRGSPYPLRMESGFGAPKQATRLGFDFFGQVEAVGKSVTRFQPGDEVFGAHRGAFAEYVCAPENAVASKPANLTSEQAAAVPIAGCTALQALRDKGHVRSGQKVLINGAAGGVGTFAVQLAKSFGAHVTGVCSTRNVEMIRSLGADDVIDYTQDDFTRGTERYDLILDLIGNHSLSAYRRVMPRRGAYVMIGGPGGRWLGPLALALKAIVVSRFVSQRLMMILASVKTADLMVLKELVEAGKMTPVIDRQYRLRDVPAAIRYLEEGHARGKLVIVIDGEDP